MLCLANAPYSRQLLISAALSPTGYELRQSRSKRKLIRLKQALGLSVDIGYAQVPRKQDDVIGSTLKDIMKLLRGGIGLITRSLLHRHIKHRNTDKDCHPSPILDRIVVYEDKPFSVIRVLRDQAALNRKTVFENLPIHGLDGIGNFGNDLSQGSTEMRLNRASIEHCHLLIDFHITQILINEAEGDWR